MKSLKLIAAGVAFFLSVHGTAQVSVNVNLGSPPQWGPAGYAEARYYYLPDIEAYYDVQSSMFIYYGDGVWVRRAYLPSRYSNYDLYYGYKIVMNDYRGETPYINFKEHKMKYAKGYRGENQKTIGEKPGKGNSQKRDFPNERSGEKSRNDNDGGNKSEYQGGDRGHGGEKEHGGHGRKK